MRMRTVLCATALATVAAFPLAGVAGAQEPTDRDCPDFASQAAAQSALASHSGDPERLDADHDGWACEEHFKVVPPGPAPAVGHMAPPQGHGAQVPPVRPAAAGNAEERAVVPPPAALGHAPVRTVPEHQILVRPHGAADTGDGSAAPTGTAPVVLLAGGLGVAGVVGVTGALGARRRATRR